MEPENAFVFCTVEPGFKDTRLIRTPLLRTVVLVPAEGPYILSKIYPLNADTRYDTANGQFSRPDWNNLMQQSG